MSWSIEHEQENDLYRVIMNSGKANAMNPAFFEEMLRHLEELEKNPRPLVLTAAGNIFCAGLDLVALGAMQRPELEEFFGLMDRALLRLFQYPAPTIAAVTGHAIAGGAVLALACDGRVLARGKMKFGLSEVAVGVSFPSVAFEIVRGTVPARYAREVLMFATLYDPAGALEHGLADELVEPDELAAAAAARARKISADSLPAFDIVKRQVNRPVLEAIERNKSQDDRLFFDNWFSESCQRRMAEAIAGFKKG